GLGHSFQELSRVHRKAFDIAPLPFGIERIESERRFSRSADARKHMQFVASEVERDIFQIMQPRAANGNRPFRRRKLACRLAAGGLTGRLSIVRSMTVRPVRNRRMLDGGGRWLLRSFWHVES